jgi:hypothetical protein
MRSVRHRLRDSDLPALGDERDEGQLGLCGPRVLDIRVAEAEERACAIRLRDAVGRIPGSAEKLSLRLLELVVVDQLCKKLFIHGGSFLSKALGVRIAVIGCPHPLRQTPGHSIPPRGARFLRAACAGTPSGRLRRAPTPGRRFVDLARDPLQPNSPHPGLAPQMEDDHDHTSARQ